MLWADLLGYALAMPGKAGSVISEHVPWHPTSHHGHMKDEVHGDALAHMKMECASPEPHRPLQQDSPVSCLFIDTKISATLKSALSCTKPTRSTGKDVYYLKSILSWTKPARSTGKVHAAQSSEGVPAQECARVLPESLRHRLAWQQHFVEEDWVLESYATEASMPRTPEHQSLLSARLSSSGRQARSQTRLV